MQAERVECEVVELHAERLPEIAADAFSPTVLAIPEGLSFEAWAELGEDLRTVINAGPWWVGDWLVYAHAHFELDDRGQPDPAARAAVYQRLAELGFEHETVERYRRVCALFPPTLRHESLSWSHHAEVSHLELEEACDLLIAAGDNGWGVRKLRDAVRAARVIETTSAETTDVHGISVRFKAAPPAVVAERLARGIEKTLRDLGLDGDVKVR